MESKQKQKKISIGVEDFKTLIDWNGYFVDKTLMIKELIESNAKVTLFTRPRRFGKTLNQFMIRRFFEDERTEKGEKIDKLLYGGYSTISLGYAGLYECVKYMTGKSHTDPAAKPFALLVMQHMKVSEAGYVCARLHGIKETPERGVQAAQICFDGRYPDNG